MFDEFDEDHGFKSAHPVCPNVVLNALRPMILAAQPVGSRITCNPPPADTDEDWLVLVNGDPKEALLSSGFMQDGRPGFYTGSDVGTFRSWRMGDLNVITTPDPKFYELFLTATMLAKRFNLLDKGDRIALFQAVLYQVRYDSLEWTHGNHVDSVFDQPQDII